MTHPKLQDFINHTLIPGFYLDVRGAYCIVINKYLISVFVNSCDEELDVTIDGITKEGFFDENIEWETPADYKDVVETIQRFVKYAIEH